MLLQVTNLGVVCRLDPYDSATYLLGLQVTKPPANQLRVVDPKLADDVLPNCGFDRVHPVTGRNSARMSPGASNLKSHPTNFVGANLWSAGFQPVVRQGLSTQASMIGTGSKKTSLGRGYKVGCP